MALVALLGSITASAAQAEYDFTATTHQGQTFYYKILTDTDAPDRKIVAVTNGQHNDGQFSHFDISPYDDYGDIIIPSTVRHNDVTYTVIALQNTFAKAYHVTSITLPNTIESISQWTFTGCRALQSITIPENVTNIGPDAISDWNGVDGYQTQYVTDKPLTNIRTLYYNARQVPYFIEGAFHLGSVGSECQVVIGETVESIPRYFLYKTRVASVVMSSSVTSIGEYAFCDMNSLRTITIPKDVTSIGDYAFGHDPHAGSDPYSGSPYGCGITTVISEMETPPTINATVFHNPENMTLYIPFGTLNNYAQADYWKNFGHIIENTPIDFEDPAVKAICVEKWDTNGNNELDLTEAQSVTDLGAAFTGKSQITKFNELQYFTLLTKIPDDAFLGCSSLTEITLPKKVNIIGDYAFSSCSSLTTINLGYINRVGVRAFGGCTSLRSVKLWASTIGEYAFSGCSGLTSVSVDPETIESYTFENCTSLSNLTFGSFVKDIKEGAFKNCRALTSVNIPGSVISLNGNCFEDCTYLKTVTLNAGTKYITDEAFKGCSSLKTVTLPNGLQSIGQRVFQNTSLETIDIPSSVTNIQSNAFVDCAKLKLVTVNWTTPLTVTASAFPDRANQTLLVPEGTKATYKAANVWKDFNLIAEPGDVSDFPYAIYDATAHSLTFYNDGLALSKSGTLIYMPEGTATPGWQDYRSDITTVTFDESFTTFQPTTTARWFNGFNELTTVNGLTNLNTSQVTTMQAMFQSCFKLTQCDVSGFNTANVTNMSSMFSYCRLLPSIDVSGFDTHNVTTMYAMFQGCNVVTTLDLSSFNTAKVTDMRYMFDECSALKTIMVGSGWSTTLVTSSDDMFAACTKLVGGKGTTYNVNYRDKTYARVDGGYSNPGYLTDKGSPYAVLSTDGKTLTFYADGKRLQHTERTYSMNPSSNTPDWCTYPSSITTVVFDASMASARPTTTYGWFSSMDKLTTITNLEYLNTSEVTDMNQMFYDCEKLTNLDLSHFNTSKVTEMEEMFYGCSSLVELNLSSFNTSNVTSMIEMFSGCSSLVNLNLNSFNTSNVHYMQGMFDGCSSLVELNLSSFNTSEVTDMDYMFYKCSSLTTVSVGSGWDMTHVQRCEEMFFHCYSIVGELGTTYNSAYDEHVGEDAAHVDRSDYPGYFVSADYLTVPYALLSADKKTLTLYHDGQRGTHRTQKTYSINMADNEDPGWYLDESMYDITQVVIDPSFADARPTSTYYWFGQMNVLNGITGMEYLNTSEVTNMAGMFEECFVLTSLDVSHFDTKKVKNMAGMFNGCNELTALDVSGFDTRNVTNMYGMFATCSSLTAIDVRNFDTQKVTNMGSMFYGCDSLTSLDVSFLNTTNVTRMSYMFQDCENLTSLDLSNFNTAKVTDMSHMFYGCTNMRTICVGDGWSTNNVTESSDMFTGCTNLVGGSGTVFASTYVDKEYARVDGGTSAPGYFVDLSFNDTPYALLSSDGTTLTFYRDSKRITRAEKSYNMNEGENAPGWRSDDSYANVTTVVFDESFAQARPTTTASWFAGMTNLTTITGIENLNTSEVTSMRSMFFNCSSLTSIDVSHFDTQNVTSMRTVFYNCSGLTSIDVSHFDTRNVTIMRSMFSGCSSLTSLNVSNFDTRNVTDMSSMFLACSSLTSLDVSSFNTSNVTDMSYLFQDCSNLTTFDLRNFNTQNVTNLSFMFYRCTGLTDVNLSSFNTQSVTTLSYMFGACPSLTTLDLSSFNTATVTYMSYMFVNCSNLKTIYVGDGWSTEGLTGANSSTNMFAACTSIVGGKGTVYDSSHWDKEYARIDGGASNPGYFSEKGAPYAVLSSDGKTLTFYCDNLRSSHTETTYDLNEGNNIPAWVADARAVNKVVFDESFQVARPTSMYLWFSGMTDLTTFVNLDILNTKAVINMSQLFIQCTSLTRLDLTSFDTQNVTDMNGMFWYCTSLQSLDLSSFDTENVTDMSYMFQDCSNLKTIYANSLWNRSCSTENMFQRCESIVGGRGTTYDANHIDGEYAHIDGGTSNPGYFTAKPAFLLGDVNGDGQITIADVTALVNIILGKDTTGQYNHAAADVNQDNQITIADVTALVNIILGKN